MENSEYDKMLEFYVQRCLKAWAWADRGRRTMARCYLESIPHEILGLVKKEANRRKNGKK